MKNLFRFAVALFRKDSVGIVAGVVGRFEEMIKHLENARNIALDKIREKQVEISDLEKEKETLHNASVRAEGVIKNIRTIINAQ